MANRAYLVGSSHDDTAGPSAKGINHDPDTEILAGASAIIPVFWLSLFNEFHLKTHIIEEYKIPAPVCQAAEGRKILLERRSRILATFAQCEPHWEAWERLITEAPFQFIKLDSAEVWDLEPEVFEADLPLAVRWFSSGSADDFAKLLSVAEIPARKPRGFLGRILGGTPSGYDSTTKRLSKLKDWRGQPDSVKHHLHGYKWVREVPWKDGEES
jgi:hypothetical protein